MSGKLGDSRNKMKATTPTEHDDMRRKKVLEEIAAGERVIEELQGSSEAAEARRHTPFAV